MTAAGGRSRRGALVRVGVAALAMAAVASGSTVFGPADGDDARPTSERKPLSDVTLVCPNSIAGGEGEPTTTVQAMTAPIDVPRPSGDGALQLREMNPGKEADGGASKQAGDSVNEPGRSVSTTLERSGSGPITAHGTGPLAPVLGAVARAEADSGSRAGLAETGCHPADSDFWFVGASAEKGRNSRLYLTNIENTSARVTISVRDAQGQVSADEVRGVDIAGRDRMVVDLDDIAPLSSDLAVHVTAERGRVAAGLLDRAVDAGEGRGIDWIGTSTPPSKKQLLPGVVPGKGARELTLVAPGETSASVELSVLGQNGEFRPAEPKQIQVEAGTVAQVVLQKATGGEANAIRLESDEPVTASLRSARTDDSDRDIGYTPTVRPFRTPAVVGSTPVGSDRKATLALSNPGGDPAKAVVRHFAPDGKELSSNPVTIASGVTEVVDLPDADRPYTTVVDPGDSALLGSRTLTDGAKVSSIPLRAAPLDALRPVVEPDPAAGLG